MNDPKPIPTRYAGYHFRSRLEARWAVFFDALGLRWHYEDQGYELPSGRYLPDFRLEAVAGRAGRDIWCEVKGRLTLDQGKKLLQAAAELPRAKVEDMAVSPQILVLGDIPNPDPPQAWAHWRLDVVADQLLIQVVHWGWTAHGARWILRPIDEPSQLAVHKIPFLTEQVSGILDDWLCGLTSEPALYPETAVLEAYRAARSARFEHGQSGAT